MRLSAYRFWRRSDKFGAPWGEFVKFKLEEAMQRHKKANKHSRLLLRQRRRRRALRKKNAGGKVAKSAA